MDSLALVVATEAALLETNPEILGAGHHEPSADKNTQITHQKKREASDDQNLRLDWKSEVQLSDDSKKYHDFLNMLSDFQFMWNSQLGQVCIAEHRIELTDNNTKLIHSVPYQAGPKATELEKAEINEMLLQKIIKPL